MRAQAREAFTCYWHYALVSVSAGETVTGELAAYLLATGCPVDELTDSAGPEPEPTRKRGGGRRGTSPAGDSG